jgi:hypothetical protein
VSDELVQGAADLVIAAKVSKIGAQKHVAALAIDALRELVFNGLSHAVKVRHFKGIFNTKSKT